MLKVLPRVRSRCPIGVRTTTSQSRCTSSTHTPIMHLSATSSRPRICRLGERHWLADPQKAKGFGVHIEFALNQVKVSKHVDAAGKIYLPYLHEWAHPQSDLVKS